MNFPDPTTDSSSSQPLDHFSELRRGEAAQTLIKPRDGGVPPLAVSVRECCELTSLSRTTCFELIRENRLEVRRIGRRTLVLMRSINSLLGLDTPVDKRS